MGRHCYDLIRYKYPNYRNGDSTAPHMCEEDCRTGSSTFDISYEDSNTSFRRMDDAWGRNRCTKQTSAGKHDQLKKLVPASSIGQ